MSDKLKAFVDEVFKNAESRQLTVEEVHLLPLAMQMELEKTKWVRTPYKRKMPQGKPRANPLFD